MKLNRILAVLSTAVLLATSPMIQAIGALGPSGGAASAGLYTSNPPLVVSGADPFLMIDLSVELTQQAEAYTDALQTYPNGTVCPGRIPTDTTSDSEKKTIKTAWGNKAMGICYSANERYIGYFDSEKCYTYDSGDGSTAWAQQAAGPYPANGLTAPSTALNSPHFRPTSLATNHTCSAAFSGNFLNWATMTALDEFRGAMTGGARLVDTSGSSAKTLLVRTRRFDDWGFVMKAISGAGSGISYTNSNGTTGTFKNDPTKVTPFSLGASTSSTTSDPVTCSCGGNNGLKCGSKNPDSCSCTTKTDLSYAAADKLYVVNDWSQISPNPGKSYHRTRFYTFQDITTTVTTYRRAIRNGSECNSDVNTGQPTTAFGARQLAVGTNTDFNVIVKVCDPGSTGETALSGDEKSSCTPQTDGTNKYYKPEGLLQKNALKMSYALTSYTGRTGNAINGGVLRSNAKYIGDKRPMSNGGLQDNPQRETTASGLVVFDPEGLKGKIGVNSVAPINSGIINYINQFALSAGKYKSNDPDAELYYEGLRYIMNLGPTASFWNPPSDNGGALSAADQDGYPVLGANTAGSPAWTDPVVSSCQKNFALYVGDKNTHRNDYIPGGTSLAADDPTCGDECAGAVAKGINATSLINSIGALEGAGINASKNGGSSAAGYGTAALAWWANTHDIRTDKVGNQRLKTFMVDTQEYGSSTPVGKGNLLWMAAKWGGFEESSKTNYDPLDNNIVSANTALSATPKPDVQSEWNAKGAVYVDGTRLPDTYTLASQPANLVSGLTQVFAAAATGSSASSAAAVVANSAYGVGSMYEALYEPQLSSGGAGVGWTGVVRAFFLDDLAQTREDTDGNGALTDADLVVRYHVDPNNPLASVADLYKVDGTLVRSNVAVRDLKPVWDAANRLAALTNSSIGTQRTYGTSTTSGRYITTWIDSNNNGAVDAGEQIGFTASNFPNITATNNDTTLDRARFLGLDSTNGSQSANIVNFIRGQENIANFRNRTIDLGDGNGALPRRLGDVVHSSPLYVGPPQQAYDVTFKDASYAAFKSKYAARRPVVYAGANDGMLHAFNGGFFDPATKTYAATDKHPLGGELWAFVPQSLLPHLRWLTEPTYQHTYYVDGSPQSFDVNTFPADTDHPGGWGTILVVGYRLGGGEITINSATDQTGAADTANRTLRPSYLVFDITNPEVAPKLLAEISDPLMGYTMSQPTVVKHRVLDSGGTVTANQWYLVMGSGPIGTNVATSQTAHDKAVSYRPARVFVYDLNLAKMYQFYDPVAKTYSSSMPVDGAAEATSFVGDMTPMDWLGDFTDEVIYFGTVGGTDTGDPTGSLYRLVLDYTGAPKVYPMLNVGSQPFSAPPLATFDSYKRPWVFAGTGRFYTSNDVLSAKQMSYYGIKEDPQNLAAPIAKSALANTTGIRVSSESEAVRDKDNSTPFTVNGQSVSTFTQLVSAVDAGSGWYIDLDTLPARDVDRSLSDTYSVFFVQYTASNDSCSPTGNSTLFAPNLLTGTASPFAAIDTDATVKVGSTETASALRKNLGIGQSFLSGMYTAKGVNYIGTHGSTGTSTFTRAKGPTVVIKSGRTSWRELPVE